MDKNKFEADQIKIILIIKKILILKMREMSVEERKRKKNCFCVLDKFFWPFACSKIFTDFGNCFDIIRIATLPNIQDSNINNKESCSSKLVEYKKGDMKHI